MSDEHRSCNGRQLKELAAAGLSWLESHYRRVNELNVFPVPDGDTGTNMLLTMRNANKEITQLDSTHVGKVAGQIAHGAMMGSRGNSGTILSQLWLGFARTIGEARELDVELAVKAFRTATDTAYRGVQRPVEGTILTVAREMTEEAEALTGKVENLVELLEKMVARGWDAVQRTPELLPTLKNAGVVDSGGTGLMYVLEGMLRHIKGQPTIIEGEADYDEALEPEHEGGQYVHPGENFYDVQFVIKGNQLNVETIKVAIERMGESAVVVKSDLAVKVHVHVHNPGIPLNYAANIGQITDVVVENMLEQYEEFLSRRQPEPTATIQQVEAGQIAVIAVTPGPGLASVFQQLGVAALVNGGQTNNPSVEEFVKTIEALETDKIIVLPNNKNIILTAQQVANLVQDRQIVVIPTRTVPQGISAMFPYQPDGELDTVAQAMEAAKDNIISGEVTTAVRDVELDGVDVKEGQIIGLLDGKLRVSTDSLEQAVHELLSYVEDIDDMEIVTLYYGADIGEDDAFALVEFLQEIYPDLEFETVLGGQPYYPYILSVE
ncbi:MAG: DAK2 domain-containing protein [Anaerolineales bacterium]|nr:DAK2 domain-containing protein [Anaerolineales bacterium]